MATSTMEIESGNDTSNKSDKCELSTIKWILIIVAAVIFTGLVTNIDRMVAPNDNDNDNDSSPTQSYENEYDIVIIGAGVTGSGNLLIDRPHGPQAM